MKRLLLAVGEGKIIGVDGTTDGGGSGGGSDGAVRRGGFRWGGLLNGCAAIDTIFFAEAWSIGYRAMAGSNSSRAGERMSGIRFMAESSIFRVLRTGYHRKQS